MVRKKDLDVVRARWTTSGSVAKFYDVLFAATVGLGVAEALPNVTLDREGALQLRFFQPQLLVSMDETCVLLSPVAARERTGHHQRARGQQGIDAAFKGAPEGHVRLRAQGRGSTIVLYGGVRRSRQATR